MKVSELIVILKTMSPDLDVVIRDADTHWPLDLKTVIVNTKFIELEGDYGHENTWGNDE